jgi:hypothetical protein
MQHPSVSISDGDHTIIDLEKASPAFMADQLTYAELAVIKALLGVVQVKVSQAIELQSKDDRPA